MSWKKINIKVDGKEIVEKINDLPLEPVFQIAKEHIKGLDEEFEKVNNRFGGVSKAIGGINIGALKRHLLNIDVSSQCNGDTRTFTIPSNFGIFGVFSTQDPKIFRPTIDYTAGNRTVILDTGIHPIQSGQTLIIQIFK